MFKGNKIVRKMFRFLKRTDFQIMVIVGLILVTFSYGATVYSNAANKETLQGILGGISDGQLEISEKIEVNIADNIKAATRSEVEMAKDIVASYFEEPRVVVDYLSISKDFTSSKGFESKLDEVLMKDALSHMKVQSGGKINDVHILFIDGDYYSSSGKDRTGEDVRLEPWYQNALNSPDEVIYNSPIIEGNDRRVMYLSKLVRRGTSKLAVIAVEVDLNPLVRKIEGKVLSADGYLVLLDKDGVTINHPVVKDLVGKEVVVPEMAKYAKSNDYKTTVLDYVFQDENKVSVLGKVDEIDFSIIGAVKIVEIEKTTAGLTESFDEVMKSSKIDAEGKREANNANKAKLIIGLMFVAMFILWLFARYLTYGFEKLSKLFNRLAAGNFKKKSVKSRFSTIEVENMTNQAEVLRNNVAESLNDVLVATDSIQNVSESIEKGGLQLEEISTNIVDAAEEISKGATEQANDAENVAVAVGELSESINGVLENNEGQIAVVDSIKDSTKIGSKVVRELVDSASESINVVSQSVSEVKDLQKAIGTITNITGTISDIAEQTNLLALNASIEAARAGDAGKGFAVVADEIRQLAEKTSQSTEKITSYIREVEGASNSVVDGVNTISGTITKTQSSSEEMKESFVGIERQIDKLIKSIEKTAVELSQVDEKRRAVDSGVSNIVAVAEQTAASVEEVNASLETQHGEVSSFRAYSNKLSSLVEKLQSKLSMFDV